MKTAVNIYVSSLDSSVNFERNVAKVINDKLIEYGQEAVGIIELEDAGMSRLHGHGQYSKFVRLKIDGHEHYMSKHTTDSQTYDELTDREYPSRTDNNFYKRFILSLLEKVAQNLVEEIMENRESDNKE